MHFLSESRFSEPYAYNFDAYFEPRAYCGSQLQKAQAKPSVRSLNSKICMYGVEFLRIY